MICSRKVLEKRQRKDIPSDILSVIDVVTANLDTLPVGTFKYKVFKFPSDVDLFENLEACCNYNKVKLELAGKIQSIIRDLQKHPNYLFSDFKAGYDNRFKIYTGVITDKVEDYDPVTIRRDLNNLSVANLLTTTEHRNLLSLVKDRPSIKDVTRLNEELRKYWVLRWNPCELLRGYKILPGNYQLYLDVALTQGSIVKLDVIAPTDGRYVEVTDFYVIKQKDTRGNVKILSEELHDYEQSLLEDVYKYYDIKTIKAVKRLWMYLAYKQDTCDLNMFTPLFSSEIAYYAQVAADIEVALELLTSDLHYDWKYLSDSLRNRIASLNGVCVSEPIFIQANDQQSFLTNLQLLHDCLQNKVNIMTKEWLGKNKIDIFQLAKNT